MPFMTPFTWLGDDRDDAGGRRCGAAPDGEQQSTKAPHEHPGYSENTCNKISRQNSLTRQFRFINFTHTLNRYFMGIVIFLFTDAVLDFLMTAARNRSKFTLMGLKPPSPRASTSPAPDFSRPSICGERSQRQSALAESSRGKLRARLLRFIAPGNVRAALSDTPASAPSTKWKVTMPISPPSPWKKISISC